MDIETQFNLVANEYDAGRRKFVPCFADLYGNTRAFIASNIKAPKSIVDLGAGTGLLSYYWYKHFPQAKYTLTDIADDMLNVARRRFEGLDVFSYQVSDYSKALPDNGFDTVISALSVHHLEDGDKQALFADIYKALPSGGMFVNYDQFCAGDEVLDKWYDSYWEGQLAVSGLSEHDIALWQERRKLDRECSVEAEADMLKSCGFTAVKCVYSYQKFAVLLAIK